ncbi:MAG: GNAT family N-acetyltransferase [Cyanobacteria bacterium SID2]|nr:GNAT family N-acetyltransferase [Cyanobacteria bacterium SID2]MBP0003154.1 GNAT family N-acetyltransferase [Cyanobacteria bacterium SBC]
MNDVVVESGILKRRNDRDVEELPYEIRRLSSRDLIPVLKIRQFASETYGVRFLDRRPSSQIEQILSQNISLGLFCQNELAGIRLTGYPSSATLYLLECLPIPPQEIDRDARLTGVVVLPPYRGQQFGSRLTQINLQHLAQLGKDRVWATVSPFNYPSLSIFLRLNFRIYDLIQVHGKFDRFILKTESQMQPLAVGEVERVEHCDLATQRARLDRGWVGYAIERHALGYRIAYARELQSS